MQLVDRRDQSIIGQWWWSVDRSLLAALVLLMGFGIFLVATASPPIADRLNYGSFYFLKKHTVFLVVSAIGLFVTSLFDKRTIRRLAVLGFIGCLLALIATLIIGTELNGARRWLSIGGFSLQVSEFVKPTFAVTAAWLLAEQHRDERFPGYLISCGLCGLVICLLLLQPDLGMTVVVIGVWSAQMFLAGLPLSLVVSLFVVLMIALLAVYFTFPHVTSRVDRFFDPSSGDTFQVDRSIEAFKNGGLFGTGPGQGEIKMIVPDSHADFIFAIAGEELGLILTLLLVGLFLFIVLRGMKRVKDSDNLFILLAVAGLLTQFGGQAFIHMGSSLQLLPAKGMTLPFVSYGGSSILALGIGMGMVLGLTRHNPKSRRSDN